MEPTVCPFCAPEAELIFHQGEHVIGLYDAFPVSRGHALLVTRRHTPDWFSATPAERAELMAATQVARDAITARFEPDGFNIGVDVGAAAGLTIYHVHVHVIPRYQGDAENPRGGIRWVLPGRADYLGDAGRIWDATVKSELVESYRDLSGPYAKVLLRFRNVMQAPTTFARVMSITPLQFGNHRGVGTKYVKGLASLQQEIRAAWPYVDWSDHGTRSGAVRLPRYPAQLDRALLSTEEDRALGKLRRHLGHEPGIDELVDLDLTGTLDVQGFGRQSVQHLMRLRRRVTDVLRSGDLGKRPEDPTKRSLVVVAWPGGLATDVLDALLLADLERFLEHLDDRWATVVSARLGFRTARATPTELATALDVSPQRVRQVVARSFDAFSHHLRVHPNVVRASVVAVDERALSERFPRLAEAFGGTRGVRRFLELAADAEKGTLYPYRPSGQLLPANAIDPFFADHAPPVPQAAVAAHLAAEHGLSDEEQDHHLRWLVADGRILVTGDVVEPLALTRSQAIAHILADEPEGLPWAEVAARINARGCSRYPVNEERLSGFSEAPRVYLWGKGVYRHLRYFEEAGHDIDALLSAVRAHLLSRDLGAANLHDVHRSLSDGSVGYFDLRYVVSSYGEDSGLFFQGTSKVDTVSLSEDANPVPREEAVYRIVEESSRPLRGPEIASRLHSTSPAFVSVLVQRLVAAGRIVGVRGGYVPAAPSSRRREPARPCHSSR